MAHARFMPMLAVCIGSLAAACSATTGPAPQAGFQIADPAPRAAAPAAAQPSGFQINGADFAGDFVFAQRDGRTVATYRHAVDGAATLVADMEIGGAFLVDGVQRFAGISDRGVDVLIELVAGPCTIGRHTHARFATIQVGRLSYEGCAREVGPGVTWAEDLPRYLSAISACETEARQSSMAFARRGEGAVVHARQDGGAAVIRYQYGQSGRWECRFEAGRANWTIVSDEAPRLPDEGFPRFIPGRVPDAGEGCYLYERVEAPDGRVLGALAHDACTPGFASLANDRFG